MTALPLDQEIESLLEDLGSENRVRRFDAAQRLGSLQQSKQWIIDALKVAAATDTDQYVRQAAHTALVSLGVPADQFNSYPAPIATAERVRKFTRNQKIVYFTAGFAGWFLVSSLLWLLLTFPHTESLNSLAGIMFGCLAIPVNLVVVSVLAFKQKWVAIGMVTAMTVNLFGLAAFGIKPSELFVVPFFIPGLR